jgi:hypothetical protein
MPPVRRLVVDVLKPHDPPLLDFTEAVADAESVESVCASLIELDTEVQNVEMSLEGEAVDFDAVEGRIEQLGGTVHSVDEVVCGEYLIEDRHTRQDD